MENPEKVNQIEATVTSVSPEAVIALAETSECKYRPETAWRRVRWILLGTVFGMISGFLVSSYRVYLTNEEQRVSKTRYWVASVVDEMDYNLRWGTNSPSFTVQADTIPLKSYLRDSALRSFLDILPELRLKDAEVGGWGRTLQRHITTFNQLVDLRNAEVNARVPKLNWAIHEKQVANYESKLNDMLGDFTHFFANYKSKLVAVSDSL